MTAYHRRSIGSVVVVSKQHAQYLKAVCPQRVDPAELPAELHIVQALVPSQLRGT